MSQNDLTAKVHELREFRRMADEIAAEIEAIQDSLKEYMNAAGVDQISGIDWKVTYKAVTSSRLDTAALKKALPDVAAEYTKQTTTKRFLLA